MKTDPRDEHRWLDRLVGEWTFEFEAPDEPGGQTQKHSGREVVRSLGGVWVVCEAQGELPDGGESTTIMTLGFEPTRNRYVGTFLGSMMTYLWVYEGQLESDQRLVLNTEGPSFSGDGTIAPYRDTIEFLSPDHRVLSSASLDGGNWSQFMTCHYRRV